MFLTLSGFWLVFLSIIALIFIIGLIVCLHELGHFLVARKAGIKCYEFSIGMGPAIYKHQFKETLFCIRAIPIGGYVSMASEEISCNLVKSGDKVGLLLEDDKVTQINLDPNLYADVRGSVSEVDFYDNDNNGMYINILDDDSIMHSYLVNEGASLNVTSSQSFKVVPYRDCFDSKSLLKRFLTLFAGPLMNFILAILLYFIYFCFIGVPNFNSNQIGEVGRGYNSYGILETNDKIVAVAGNEVKSWNEFEVELDKILATYQTEVDLAIEREGKIIEETLSLNVIINSIGLSNLEVDLNKYPASLTSGAIVGNVALNYNDNKEFAYELQNGDVITKMKVDVYKSSNEIIPGEVVIINSWQDIINNLKDIDVADIYFEYYSYEKAKTNPNDPYVKIEDSKAVRSWGNEMLENQRINKIDLKLGISPTYHFDLGGIIVSTFKQFWLDFTLIFRTLKLLVAPSGIRQVGVSDLSSVVGIFGMVEKIIVGGILPLIAFTAMLSINIAIVNLLPIPALDGGRIVFLGYELITRRKPNKKFEAVLNNIFFILMLILFIYVTINDIGRLMHILI